MNIKILCACGTKFSFAVEPLDGKMPERIFCPQCGVDVTDAGNAMIQSSTADAVAAESPVAPKPRARLHVATPAAPESANENPALAGVEMCHRHGRNVATARCAVCQKPICPECMQSFGYLCSINCRYRAEQEGIRVPKYKLQKGETEKTELHKTLAITGAVALVVALLVGGWLWFIFAGSKPKTFYTLPVSGKGGVQARFLGPEQILLFKPNEVALHNIKTKKNTWVTPLEDPKPAPAPAPPPVKKPLKKGAPIESDEEGDSDFSSSDSSIQAAPVFSGDDVWLCLSHRAVCLDLKTGAVKHTVLFRGRLSAFTPGESSLLLVSEPVPGRKNVTQIALATGEAKTTEVVSSLREKAPAAKELPPEVLPTAALLLRYEIEGAEKGHPSIYKFSSEFFPAGQNLVEMQVKLLELKVATVNTMKKAGPSQINADTRASTSSRAVLEEISNEIKRNRGGGFKRVDESRYAVLLRRTAEPGAADWSGEVAGMPVFFPQKTVDVLVAGKMLYVFDKQNKKIGESQLQYPVDDHFTSGSYRGAGPCAETNNTLFVYDKGVLMAFDLPGVSVRWRLTSVGIGRIQFDEKGMLYVNTTTATPEDIQYSEQIKVQDAIRSIVLKVDPKSGKTLWKSDQYGEGCFLTGKFVYMTDASRGGVAMILAVEEAFETPSRGSGSLNIFRVNPANGKQWWWFNRKGAPEGIDFCNNRILLQYADEIQVMKFISF